MPFCTQCGAQAHPDAQFCMSCRARIVSPQQGTRYAQSPAARQPGGNVFVYAQAENKDDPNYDIDFFEVEVAGESHYESAFVKILGRVAHEQEKVLDDVVAVLIREPENPYDSDAVAVHVVDTTMTYQKVGHLSSHDAEEYVETIEELERRTGQIVGCLARVHGRGKTAECHRPVYSARVYLPDAEEWLKWR